MLALGYEWTGLAMQHLKATIITGRVGGHDEQVILRTRKLCLWPITWFWRMSSVIPESTTSIDQLFVSHLLFGQAGGVGV